MTKKPIDHSSEQFKRGLREEMKEHPSLSKKDIERITSDHISLHPYMYKK